MQQPAAQYSVAAQSSLVSHGVRPPGHSFISLHSGGRSYSVSPGHSTQSFGSALHSPPVHSSNFWHGVHSSMVSGLPMSVGSQVGEARPRMSAHSPVSGLQIVQQPKQSQPGGVRSMHSAMQESLKSQSMGGQLPYLPSAASHCSWDRRQQVSIWQLPPLLPSKKQSCFFGSTLSPGMPVAKVSSSLSSGPAQWGSRPSM